MPRILHASDLHLSESEKDYSLGVFAELIEVANREHVDYLIFCGDLFDTFVDAEKLRGEFRKILGTPTFEFLYLPGNHEELRRGSRHLMRLDWGAARVLHTKPFDLLTLDRGEMPIEFLSIPHQDQYAGYGNWPIPPKRAAFRIALAHGVVAGLSYRGPDMEGGGTAMDPDLFARFQVDYAALGHIHGRRSQSIGPVLFAYPGSTRVWRSNEDGERGCLLLDVKGGQIVEPRFLPLISAGQFRHYDLALDLEGEIPSLDHLAKEWGRQDFIELEWTGLVEDERAVAQLERTLQEKFSQVVRRLDIKREGVSALPGIASQPVVRQFLEAWKLRMPPLKEAVSALQSEVDLERVVWLRARELALNALKTHLERAG